MNRSNAQHRLSKKSGSDELPWLRIADYAFDFVRVPFSKPMGFKGSQISEKWETRVALSSTNGISATAYGGFSPLWSDEQVFLARSEAGANAAMATVAEYGLQCARRCQFRTPLDLQDQIITEVHQYACQVTRSPDLNPAFTLNALVGLDHAAWLLFAKRHHLRRFHDMVELGYAREGLPEKHALLGCVPLLSYKTEAAEIIRLVECGHFSLKISMGAPGGASAMLERDKQRLLEIHQLVAERETPHTPSGRILYYLDANGRYKSREQIGELLAFARQEGILDRITLFEEPFEESLRERVDELGVTFVADESIRSVKDLAGLKALGYRAASLKPAGKGLSVTLRMIREALRLGLIPVMSDSSCTPLMLDWNKNVAARMPTLPGMKIGLLEMSGQMTYSHWEAMLAEHPDVERTWLKPQHGMFHLDESFYMDGGGLFGSEP